jgi:Kef-type K+ transport system membrane component KefB
MKKYRNILFYILVIGGFSAIIYQIIDWGQYLEEGRQIVTRQTSITPWLDFRESFIESFHHPLAILLAQIVTIIVVARFLGWICRKIGQPTVIGEIIAGIVLGPSLIGMYFPGFTEALFPDNSLGNLQFLSQIGLILFMFVVGMELDLKVLKTKAHDAIVISHASIIIPFTLGIGLAYYIYPSFAPEGIRFSSFALFIAIAMSITAFPVLARIVQERGIHKTRLGSVVITCAAADDITAWSLLAVVIAIVKAGSFVSALYTIGLALGYVFLMLKFVRPFLRRIGELHTSRENLNKSVVAIFLLCLILSAYTTEIIGIHALFGAFMAGVIMPENARFRNIFIEKVEDVAMVLLLPLFFVFTGLRTEIGLLNNPELWKDTALIILVAVTGKFLGGALTARFVGQNWHESITIGALMNTRGLMELVVLNIGYDLGVLSSEIFAMLVIMALVTTFMTGPALDLADRIFRKKPVPDADGISQIRKYRILISFGNPIRGRSLLRLANSLIKKSNGNVAVTVMHLSPSTELHHYNIDEYERESFEPVLLESQALNQKITTLFKPSNDIESDIAEVAGKGNYDLLLIGIGQSIFEGSLLGRILGFTTHVINPERIIGKFTGSEKLFADSPFDERTRQIISGSKIPVGVLIDTNFEKTDRVLVPVFDRHDQTLISYIQKMIHNAGTQVTIADVAGVIRNETEFKESIRYIEQFAPNHINLVNKPVDEELLRGQDLLMVSDVSWKKIMDARYPWLNLCPSILIIHHPEKFH